MGLTFFVIIDTLLPLKTMCAQVPNESNSPIEDGMRLMKQCPLCQTDYKFDQIDVIDEDAGAHLVHITCDTCAGNMLAILMLSGFGMSSVGMITDLSATDIRRLQDAEPISADDVLSMYEALHTKRQIEGTLVREHNRSH